MAVCGAVFDRHVAALDIAGLLQTLAKRGNSIGIGFKKTLR
jgi:hypothetical protein